MDKGYNSVTLLGEVVGTSAIRKTHRGYSVMNAELMIFERTFDTYDNVWKPSITWVRLVLFKDMADDLAKYVADGHKALFVKGVIRNKSWEDSQGVARRTTEISVTEQRFLEFERRMGPGIKHKKPPVQTVLKNEDDGTGLDF